MSTKLDVKKLLMWLLCVGLPLAIWMIPTTEAFTPQMRTFLVVTVFAILVIALEPIPKTSITFLLPVVYVLLGLADAATAWYPWTMPTVWMVIGALLLVNTLDSSGILLRISYKIIMTVGGSYKGLVLGMCALGVVLNVILFGNAYVVLAGLAYGLCRALNLPKFSKEATGIFIAAAIGGIIPGGFCYGANILMLEAYGEPVVGPMRIAAFDWVFFNIPMIIYYILAAFLILLLFKNTTEISGREYFKTKLSELGAMTATEKKAVAWIVILFVYVIYCGIVGADCTWGFIIIPALTTIPGIGCGSEDDVKRLDFTFILFIASCMSIGFVASALGFGPFIANLTTPLTQNATPEIVTVLLYAINVLLNFLLTPMAIMAGFTTTFLEIATSVGINPYVVYAIEAFGLDQILFPYEYALYMLYFSFGFISMKDFVKYFGAKMVMCALIVPFVAIPFWKITGLFFM